MNDLEVFEFVLISVLILNDFELLKMENWLAYLSSGCACVLIYVYNDRVLKHRSR